MIALWTNVFERVASPGESGDRSLAGFFRLSPPKPENYATFPNVVNAHL